MRGAGAAAMGVDIGAEAGAAWAAGWVEAARVVAVAWAVAARAACPRRGIAWCRSTEPGLTVLGLRIRT